MSTGSKKSINKQRGAIMIEQALMAPIIFAILSAIIDFGIMIDRYTIFTHLTAKYSREVALEISSGTEGVLSCADISSRITDKLRSDSLFNELGGEAQIQIKSSVMNEITPIFPGGPLPPSELKVRGEMGLSCLLCGMPGLKNFQLSTVLSSGIHNRAYSAMTCSE